MKVRVGIPLTGGKLVSAAREAGYPVLFSANAFAVTYPEKHERAGSFRKFKTIDQAQFAGLDAALDSAGFVAAVKYGDYRWTPEQYIELAAAFPWAFWASMDYCCEAEIASDRPLRILRIAATAQLLGRLNRLADGRDMPRPMPVIQGWTADEYVECFNMMPLTEWPDLVGIGSVCRRHMNGPDGLLTIVDALDKVLPPNVRFHMFGVKSTAMEKLANHPRMASIDSMGWDFAARCERRTGRDMDFRIDAMHQWAEKQMDIVRDAAEHADIEASSLPLPDAQRSLFPVDEFHVDTTGTTVEAIALEALAHTWGDLLLQNAVEYADAVSGAQQDAYPLLGQIRVYGIERACIEAEQRFYGFERHMHRVASQKDPALHARLLALPESEAFLEADDYEETFGHERQAA